MCLWDPALIDEVGSGRMQLGSVLSRAFDGNMKINTLVHVRSCALAARRQRTAVSMCVTGWYAAGACVPAGWRQRLDAADGACAAT